MRVNFQVNESAVVVTLKQAKEAIREAKKRGFIIAGGKDDHTGFDRHCYVNIDPAKPYTPKRIFISFTN